MSNSHNISLLQEYVEKRNSKTSTSEVIADWLLKVSSGEIDGNVTSDLLYAISDRWGSQQLESYLSKKPLIEFISDLAELHHVERVLDPTCGSGLLLKEVSNRARALTTHGIDINSMSCKIAQALLGSSAEVFLGDALRDDLPLADNYDLIVAEPPFEVRFKEPLDVPGFEKPFAGIITDALICWAYARLSNRGKAIFVMPESVLWSRHSKQAIEALHKLGGCISALIQIPAELLQGTGIKAYITIIEQGQQHDVFVGQFKPDTEHQKTLIQNYKKRKSGIQYSQGYLCGLSQFRGFGALEAIDRTRRLAKLLRFKSIAFDQIVLTVQQLYQDGKEEPEPISNSIYLNTVGKFKAFLEPEKLPEKKHHYVRLHLNPDLVEARYFISWLESEIGQSFLATSTVGSVLPKLHINSLRQENFFLPTIDKQRYVIHAIDRLAKIRSEARELEKALWESEDDTESVISRIATINREDHYNDWIDTLPFPLASILWRHRTSTASFREKYEILLHFFEALSEFIAIIHLSAFSTDRDLWASHREELHTALNNQNLSLDRATFGTWKCAVEYLSARGKKIFRSQSDICHNLYSTHNNSVLKMLFNTNLATTLQKANAMRNNWSGHAGAISHKQAEHIHAELMDLVQTTRNIFGITWLSYELIQAGEGRYQGGLHKYKVRRMVGTRSTPFESVDRECTEPFEDGFLYLFDPGSDRGLKLLPLVKIMPSPRTATPACYFYNRKEKHQYRYLSYHFEEDSELIDDFADVAEMLKRLGLS